MKTTTKVHVSEYDRAEWPETSQLEVSAPDADGMVTVTETVETDWTASALDRYSVGMLVTAEEADALAEIGEVVPPEQIGEPR